MGEFDPHGDARRGAGVTRDHQIQIARRRAHGWDLIRRGLALLAAADQCDAPPLALGDADLPRICRTCRSDFVWTADEQRAFQRYFGTAASAPRRCAACRARRRARTRARDPLLVWLEAEAVAQAAATHMADCVGR